MEAAQKLKINNSITMLLKHAAGDSGGSKRCAMFLLSLWSGERMKPVIDTWGAVFRQNPRVKDFHGPA